MSIVVNVTAWIGDTCIPYKLSQVSGTGENSSFHLYEIEKDGSMWYCGSFFKQRGAWRGPSHLTPDEVLILGETLDSNLRAWGEL
jgi:hypothetical protein